MSLCRFWMVFVPGRSVPVKQHSSDREARAEAERLVRRGAESAVVLEAVAVCSLEDRPASWDALELEPERPSPIRDGP